MKLVRYLVIAFSDVQMRPSDIPKLRGYFSQKYPQDHLFHNHLPGEGFSFKSPAIQYRIIDGHPALLAINEGIDLMKRVFLEIDELKINDRIVSTFERAVILREESFGKSTEFHNYRFASPWMALNSENYSEYLDANPVDRSAMLKRILKNNLKTLSKAFNYWIEDFDSIQIDGWFKPVEVGFHGIAMNCFKGEFTTNFIIPEYLGLGKQSARGFGVVRRPNA